MNPLHQHSHFITQLELCEVRLKDNAYFPWLVLIPKTKKIVTEWFELVDAEQLILTQEISLVSHIVKEFFNAEKINVGALGNIVPQLHVHIVARYQKDLVWPHSVWQEKMPEKHYPLEAREKLLLDLKKILIIQPQKTS